jgi:hypothetical protein
MVFAKYYDNQIKEHETGDACILIGTPRGKRQLSRPMSRWVEVERVD